MMWTQSVVVLTLCTCVVNLFTINESQIEQWATKFKVELDTHIDTVLGFKQVQGMLRKYESDLIVVPIKGNDTFASIYQNVNLKYNDLVQSVNKLRTGVEKNVGGQQSDETNSAADSRQLDTGDQSDEPGAPSPGGLGPAPPLLPGGGGGGEPPIPVKPLLRCCQPDRNRKYNGRFREDVRMEECYENVDEVLRNVSEGGLKTIFKDNLKNTVITWQYFADSSGHYIQYPANDRMCDGTSPNRTSPLLAEWYVEKLYMERKNLVILVDNGLLTTTQTGNIQTDRELIINAVKQTLKTLTPNDKVNIVTLMQSRSGRRTPEGCGDKLYVATPGNLKQQEEFISQLPFGTGDPSLTESLKKVYQLYRSEQKNNKAGFKSRTNLVLVLLSGQSTQPGSKENQILEMIAKQQQELEHSVQHFVYVVGQPVNSTVTSVLAQIADQNNGKLTISGGIKVKQWPSIPNLVEPSKPVGKEGVLEIIEKRESFPVAVATYFRRLPEQVDNAQTTIVPGSGKMSGSVLSVASVAYGKDRNDPVGVTAVDASLTEVFSDIVNIDVGQNSYGFLVDVNHGHVVLHPKLRDASDSNHGNTLFPKLQLLEPDLNETEIQSILEATEKLGMLNTSISHGRTTVTGELVRLRTSQMEPVTLYYQLVYGTQLCVVFVHFLSDREEARLQKQQQQQTHLHAPYHRIDELVPAPVDHKPDPENVCHLQGNFLSFKESVVKLSPWVFNNPVQYKYTAETLDQIVELNNFLINDGPTTLIREDMKMLIQHFVRSTDQLDSIWKDGDKEIIERFVGSTSGVFRLYPGSPLDNTFDHTHTDWYVRSVASPAVTMYHYGKVSFITKDNVIIVSKALVENGRLQGVIGMTTTRRQLTSQLIQSVPECYGGDKQCHVVEATGIILDSSYSNTEDNHLSELYPWLTKTLAVRNKLVVDWCTAFSDGYHRETFNLIETVTSDLTANDPCKQYSLRNVNGTNLFILILGNRSALQCDDRSYEICTSCQRAAPNGPYGLSIPKCQLCLSNLTTQCQCQCYCDSDLDLCEGQFKVNMLNFPMDACFYPSKPNTHQELLPGSPGPDSQLEFCPLPCAALEDLEICVQLNHCKKSAVHFPTCIWKDEDELKNLNVSRFFPTSTPKPPPTPPQLSTKYTDPDETAPAGAVSSGSSLFTGIHVPPEISQKPGATQKPDISQKPGATQKPGVTQEPDISQKPGATQKPEISQKPDISQKPEVTQKPEISQKPEVTQKKPVTRVSDLASTTPNFVTHTTKPPLVIGSTASGLHPISGAPTVTADSSTGKALTTHSDSGGMSGGAVAGLVIGVLLLVLVVAFIAIKMYNKKFRKPGLDNSSKYRTRNSLFDSTIFNRATNTVVTGVEQQSDVPYEEIQQP